MLVRLSMACPHGGRGGDGCGGMWEGITLGTGALFCNRYIYFSCRQCVIVSPMMREG